MFDYTGLFVADVLIDEIDNRTLESLVKEMKEMYEILLVEYHRRIDNTFHEDRNKWTYDHIPQHIQDETLALYNNSEEHSWGWSFTEYLDKYGYTNGETPVSFNDWFNDNWEGEWLCYE